MTEIPRETLERWALAVHEWLAADDHGSGVIADVIVGTKLDRRAVMAGIQVLRDEGLWVIQVDERGRIRASAVTEPMFTKPEYRVRCMHRSTSIDDRQRIVSCNACGDLLDPFDVLHYIAFDGELRMAAGRDRARSESARAQKELEAVKREEANAKARVRAARDRAAHLEARIRQLQAEVEGLEQLAGHQEAGVA
jgi:hypothetical protein